MKNPHYPSLLGWIAGYKVMGISFLRKAVIPVLFPMISMEQVTDITIIRAISQKPPTEFFTISNFFSGTFSKHSYLIW